jgi:hypothetical protein
LLRDIAAYSGRQGNVVGKALILLSLTFVRPGTVAQAEWDEFDLAGALWTVPFAAHLARSSGTIRQRNGLAIPASS